MDTDHLWNGLYKFLYCSPLFYVNHTILTWKPNSLEAAEEHTHQCVQLSPELRGTTPAVGVCMSHTHPDGDIMAPQAWEKKRLSTLDTDSNHFPSSAA